MKLKIVETRREKGLSQTELARRVGSTLSMVGKLERGERKMTVDWLDRFGAALGVDPQSLIDADDEPINAGTVDSDGLVHGASGMATVTLPIARSSDPDDATIDVHISDIGLDTSRRQLKLTSSVTIKIPAGSYYVYSETLKPNEVLGKLVLATTVADKFDEQHAVSHHVGILLKGSRARRYHLLTPAGNLIEDAFVAWASPIETIKF